MNKKGQLNKIITWVIWIVFFLLAVIGAVYLFNKLSSG